MKALYILSFVTILLLSSCSSLTKTQVKSVNDYSKLLKDYTLYPSAIFKNIGAIKYQAEQFNSAITGPDEIYRNLNITYEGKKRYLAEAEKLDLSIMVISNYALGLERLSSSNLTETLDTASTRLGTNINDLIKIYNSKSGGSNQIPTGFGALISKGITFIGGTYTKNQQATEVKQYVSEGVGPIIILTNTINEALAELILNETSGSISTTNIELRTNYQTFLKTTLKQNNYNIFQIYSMNKEVSSLIENLDRLKMLTEKTKNSVQAIQKAQNQLNQTLQQKKKLKEILSETQFLAYSINDIYTDYKKIK